MGPKLLFLDIIIDVIINNYSCIEIIKKFAFHTEKKLVRTLVNIPNQDKFKSNPPICVFPCYCSHRRNKICDHWRGRYATVAVVVHEGSLGVTSCHNPCSKKHCRILLRNLIHYLCLVYPEKRWWFLSRVGMTRNLKFSFFARI